MTTDAANPPRDINGVVIRDNFAEAFPMKMTRFIITAHNRRWLEHAALSVTGFATSVIACDVEAGIEAWLAESATPDGRPGALIMFCAMNDAMLTKQLEKRVGQCVLTCPTTAVFSGIDGGKQLPLGDRLRYFGDGRQISKVLNGKRFWRIPVMDGEFVCEASTGIADAVGGGNFLVLGATLDAVLTASEAAISAMIPLPGVIMPFPGGCVRSGSKVGSKYPALIASTNNAYCPTLRAIDASALDSRTNAVIEIVIDGESEAAVAAAIRAGVQAACASNEGAIHAIDAGNYGGKLGKYHFHLKDVLR